MNEMLNDSDEMYDDDLEGESGMGDGDNEVD